MANGWFHQPETAIALPIHVSPISGREVTLRIRIFCVGIGYGHFLESVPSFKEFLSH